MSAAPRVLLGAALLAAVLSTGAGAETVALVGATVHTVSGPDIPNATLVIRDSVIAGIGADLTPPAGARVIPCTGKHIYPGFVSANTVLGLVEVSSVQGTLDYSEMGDLNPNIRAEIGINPDSDLLPVTRVNGVTSALVIPRGGAIAGTAALIHLDGWTYEDMTLRAPVGLFVQWPGMTASTDDQRRTRDQAVESIRRAFQDARAYWKARQAEATSGIPRHDRDVKWDAMGKAVRGEIPVLIRASALNQIRAVLNFVDELQLTRVILVDGYDAWQVAPELRRRNISVIVGGILGPPARPGEPYDARYSIPAKLYAAQVPFCISDGGGDASNARNLPQHAATAAAYGLPRDEALKSVTLYPARLLGVGDRVGSLEPGKLADLFVADGDPLEITTHVEQVWIAGRALPMESRQTRLFHKYDARPRAPRPRKPVAAR